MVGVIGMVKPINDERGVGVGKIVSREIFIYLPPTHRTSLTVTYYELL